jgi:PAS domain S-box-containing protein
LLKKLNQLRDIKNLYSRMDMLRLLILAAVYFEVARFGFNLVPGEQVTVVWPAAGVSLASILLFGYRMWPGIFLASFLSKMSVHLPVLTGLGIASGNTLEPLIGAWLLYRYVGPDHYLQRLKGIFSLWFFGAVIGAAVGGVIGVTTLCLTGQQPWPTYGTEFLKWWLADGGGSLIITPILLAWVRGPYSMPLMIPPVRTIIEAAVLLALTIMASVIIFFHPAALGKVHVYPNILLPLLTWAAIRFGQRTVTLMLLVICGLSIWTAVNHTGFFAPNVFYLASLSVGESLILVQSVIIIYTMITLTIYAAISELREAEKQSQEDLQYLQDVIDHIPDPLLIKDTKHVLIGGNKALWEILNERPEKLIGKVCDDIFVNKDEAQSFNKEYDRVFATGETCVSEEVFTDHTGKRHVLSLKMTLIKNEKRGPSLVAVARDITSLKETEALLLQYTRELEKRNSELDDFAHVAAHDLKEPLRGMNIDAALLLEDYADKLDTEVVKRLRRIMYLSQRMTKLVSDLLRFSRLARTASVIEKVDPVAVLADIQRMMEPFLHEKNAVIVTPQPLHPLVCDKMGLEEILRNLITNAIRYNDKEHKTVEVGMLESAVSPRGPESNVFYVRDNGIGIDPQYHQTIFRIFKRLPDSAKYDETGTGMGLTFVKKIIERNNGCIWLESEPGKGTIFYFTLS